MSKKIQDILKDIERIPTLPTVVTKLTQLVRDPKTAATDIQNLINKDQSLSARVLKLVNSSFYGFSERISSINHAIVILGFNTIKNVALTASVFEMFKNKELGKAQFDLEGFWIHSVAVAGTSRIVAQKLNVPNLEDVFIAGLLHDIGKVILDQYVGDQYEEVLELVADKDMLIMDAEKEVLEVTHAQVGAWLAARWKLPPALVQMVGLHHKPELGGDLTKPIFAIHLADILVRAMGIGSGGDNKIPVINRTVFDQLEINQNFIISTLDDMQHELRDVESFVKGM